MAASNFYTVDDPVWLLDGEEETGQSQSFIFSVLELGFLLPL